MSKTDISIKSRRPGVKVTPSQMKTVLDVRHRVGNKYTLQDCFHALAQSEWSETGAFAYIKKLDGRPMITV